MHYVICYDIENDRRRANLAKRLQRHGCDRIQKSVFIAPFMARKHFKLLENDLNRFFQSPRRAPSDRLLIIPLPDEQATGILTFGDNNILANLSEKNVKVIL